jgi:hypothetical protein
MEVCGRERYIRHESRGRQLLGKRENGVKGTFGILRVSFLVYPKRMDADI